MEIHSNGLLYIYIYIYYIFQAKQKKKPRQTKWKKKVNFTWETEAEKKALKTISAVDLQGKWMSRMTVYNKAQRHNVTTHLKWWNFIVPYVEYPNLFFHTRHTFIYFIIRIEIELEEMRPDTHHDSVVSVFFVFVFFFSLSFHHTFCVKSV